MGVAFRIGVFPGGVFRDGFFPHHRGPSMVFKAAEFKARSAGNSVQAARFRSRLDALAMMEETQIAHRVERLLEAPIDLRYSKVPQSWVNGPRDILFSPRGNVIGPAAASGHIHLVITSPADKLANLPPGHPDKQDPEAIVTIITQTGSINAHSVAITTNPFNAATNDTFRNAETGVESE